MKVTPKEITLEVVNTVHKAIDNREKLMLKRRDRAKQLKLEADSTLKSGASIKLRLIDRAKTARPGVLWTPPMYDEGGNIK